MKKTFRSVVFPIILSTGLFVSTLRATELYLSAAASLTDALKEIAISYEKDTGDKLIFNFGASSALARQIEAGAPADLIFSADEAKVDVLEKAGLILPGTRKSVLSNTLIIVEGLESTISIQSAKDLTLPEIKKIALAEPKSVPAGIYAKEYLEKLGLWEKLSERVVPCENVRGALAAVESGNVEAGIVYKTDGLISKKVKIAFEIAASEGPKISYPLAIVKDSKSLDAAKKVAAYLESKSAGAVFEKFGFRVNP